MITRLLMPWLALLLTAAAPPPSLNDPRTTEGWIWQQVQVGEVADLNQRCGTPSLDVRNLDDPKWQAVCRRVDPVLLRALLTQPDLADHAPHGVLIVGARIDGMLDLRDAHVRAAEVRLVESWMTDGANLTRARLEGDLSFGGTMLGGPVDAEGLRVGTGGLFLSGAKFGGPVDLRDANVEGEVDMSDASVADQQTFYTGGLRVGAGGLFLTNAKFGGPVELRGANVEGSMDMSDASVADQQMFSAEQLHVVAGLSMRGATFGGPVDLRDANVEGEMVMEGASVADQQKFDAARLQVGAGGLLLTYVKFGGPVDLRDANVEGEMDMEGASVADQQTFDAERLHVGTDLFLGDVKFGGMVSLTLVTVEGGLDLRDSHVRQLDLEGAAVANDFVLGGRYADGSEGWLRWEACDGPSPCLNLRNAKVGTLQDYQWAWPNRITLSGFSFTHLGGITGEAIQDMRKRPIRWWRDWLSRDPVYSTQPYAQLAGVLAAAGNRDGAADIRFFGRDRERTELLRGCVWLQQLGLVEKPDDDRRCQWVPGLSLSAQQAFVGYGIGDYTFRAVRWALRLALIGAVILWFAPGVRAMKPSRSATGRGRWLKSLLSCSLWCFGASLQKVLPLITFRKEFSDFFEDPNHERLHKWQHLVFDVLVLCGWVLAGFVAAAFSGLI